MAARGIGLITVLTLTVVVLGLAARGIAARPFPAQEASPVASPVGSPAATPVDTTSNLLATVAAQETATAVSATEQALRGPQETVSAITAQNAEMQVALAALATREADSAQAVANAEATIVGLDLAQADTQATIAALTTARTDAEATIAVFSTGVAAVTATVNAVPTATPEPTATPVPTETPTPEPTATPVPQAGDVLFEADWSEGINGWAGAPEWQAVGGMIVTDGMSEANQPFLPPYQPDSLADYAVEADIQVLNAAEGSCSSRSFGVVARGGEQEGYLGGGALISCGFENRYLGIWPIEELVSLAEYPPDDSIAAGETELGDEWHTYRLEVEGNTIRLLIDGTIAFEENDNRYLSPGRAGLWSNGVEVSVRSFRIVAL